jgi:hypothetical protein
MPGDTTLIVTTRSGVRPLGVRGEPLHNAAPQLRRVLQRRLGNEAADLLAEPQVHEDGKAIDWYAGWPGPVRPVDTLTVAERQQVMAGVERTLAEIRRLGDELAGHGPREETGVVGLSLQLAARLPAPSFVFLVGDRPVIVAWGYEKDAAPALPPAGVNRVPERRSVLQAPATQGSVLQAGPRPIATATLPVAGGIPWVRTLVLALPLLLLLIGAAWLLRSLLPVEPALDIATREGPDAPPPIAAPDRLPLLRASLSGEQTRSKALKAELAMAEAELKKRIASCKPPEAPKPPPQVAIAPPPPAPPKVTPPPAPQPPPRNPNDNRLRLPSGPTNNYAFMEGCWRTDPFRHEAVQMQPGISSYCFDASGNGRLEWRRGRTACRTNAQARFSGAVLALRDTDSTCNDGSRWFADQLVCHRGADNVAQCSGNSRDAFGRSISWTVNLHKLN